MNHYGGEIYQRPFISTDLWIAIIQIYTSFITKSRRPLLRGGQETDCLFNRQPFSTFSTFYCDRINRRIQKRRMISLIRYLVTLPLISMGNICDRIKAYFIVRVIFLYIMLNRHTGRIFSGHILRFVDNISHGINLYVHRNVR